MGNVGTLKLGRKVDKAIDLPGKEAGKERKQK